MLPGDVTQASSQALILRADRTWLLALRGAVLASHAARAAL
jgi:hypothetical protein